MEEWQKAAELNPSHDYRVPVHRGMNKENMWETALHALISWAFTLMLKDYGASNKLWGNLSLMKKKINSSNELYTYISCLFCGMNLKSVTEDP